jgi:polyphosphate kinase
VKKFEFKNRELSWLEFNERVLQEAQDKTVPIIERIRFIGIFSNNLDEFFKVRYATVKRIAVSPQKNRKLYKGLTAKDLLSEINKKTIEIQNKSSKILNSIKSDLKKENIFFVDEKTIPSTQIDKIYSFFQKRFYLKWR